MTLVVIDESQPNASVTVSVNVVAVVTSASGFNVVELLIVTEGLLVHEYVVPGLVSLPVPSNKIFVRTPLQIRFGFADAVAFGFGRTTATTCESAEQPEPVSKT